MKPKKGPCKTCAAWDCPDEDRKGIPAAHLCIRHAPVGGGGFPRIGPDNECFEHIARAKKRKRAKTK